MADPDKIIVAHWNGVGLESGPYCNTWSMDLTRYEAEIIAVQMEARSVSGWHSRARAMTAGEYWHILDELKEKGG